MRRRFNDENAVTMFAPAEHLHPVAPEEFAPLAPEVDPALKSVVVTLGEQMLSACAGLREVFRTQIGSGRNYFGPDGTTVGGLAPAGEHPVWQKRASRHTLALRLRAAQVPV